MQLFYSEMLSKPFAHFSNERRFASCFGANKSDDSATRTGHKLLLRSGQTANRHCCEFPNPNEPGPDSGMPGIGPKLGAQPKAERNPAEKRRRSFKRCYTLGKQVRI